MSSVTAEEILINYVIYKIIVIDGSEPLQLLVFVKEPINSPASASDNNIKKMWKAEKGDVSQISMDEYRNIKKRINEQELHGSIHTFGFLDMDVQGGTATLEVDNVYGPLAGAGFRYTLEADKGKWMVVGQPSQTWIS